MWRRRWRCRSRAITWWWICSSPSLRGAKRRLVRRSSTSEGGSNPFFLYVARWIASRSLSSGARSRDPLAVCPAWALTRRWKSSRELVTASEVKRRASDREAGVKEAWIEAAGRRTGDRIRGGAEQGERAVDREAVVTKARRRRSGGRAAKVNGLTRGDLALRLKGRRGPRGLWSEKSAEAVVAARAAKGRTMERAKRP
jgi:hypothetical protein